MTICGNIEINELRAVPAPIATKREGSAQHRTVPLLRSKDR